MEFLDIEDLVSLIRLLRAGAIRDIGLLESAAARPRTSVFGEDAYPTLAGKAGALLESVSRNRALVDGNERLAWLAATTFLLINGFEVDMPDDEAFDLVMGVAEGVLDLSGITARLESSLRERGPSL